MTTATSAQRPRSRVRCARSLTVMRDAEHTAMQGQGRWHSDRHRTHRFRASSMSAPAQPRPHYAGASARTGTGRRQAQRDETPRGRKSRSDVDNAHCTDEQYDDRPSACLRLARIFDEGRRGSALAITLTATTRVAMCRRGHDPEPDAPAFDIRARLPGTTRDVRRSGAAAQARDHPHRPEPAAAPFLFSLTPCR